MDARVRPGLDGGERGSGLLGSNQYAHDVGLLHDQEFLAVELDLGARPFAEQHAVTDLDVDRDQLAGLVAAAGTHGNNFALRRLFLGGIGDDDAALGLLFGVNALHHDAVVQRTKFGFGHDVPSSLRFSGPVHRNRRVMQAVGGAQSGRLASTLSNRDVGVLMWAGKYGLVNVVSSK